jgi:acyl-CoA synthetase (NDP forming)
MYLAGPPRLWIYGTNSSAIEDMSRQLEARGLPTYFDLETAIKALGIAARYSNVITENGGKTYEVSTGRNSYLGVGDFPRRARRNGYLGRSGSGGSKNRGARKG